MDEKEVKEATNTEDNLVEVIESEVIEDTNNKEFWWAKYNNYPSSTSKLTGVIYLIIFISILIWVYFYLMQNKDVLDKILGRETTQTWEINTINSGEIDTDTTTDIESDNTNTANTENNTLTEEKTTNEKDPSTTANSPTTSENWNKSEEVIIKDFEKELDSLFNIIDENAK